MHCPGNVTSHHLVWRSSKENLWTRFIITFITSTNGLWSHFVHSKRAIFLWLLFFLSLFLSQKMNEHLAARSAAIFLSSQSAHLILLLSCLSWELPPPLAAMLLLKWWVGSCRHSLCSEGTHDKLMPAAWPHAQSRSCLPDLETSLWATFARPRALLITQKRLGNRATINFERNHWLQKTVSPKQGRHEVNPDGKSHVNNPLVSI